MDFLINRFLQKLESYRSFLEYDYTYDIITDSYTVRFYNLPPELNARLIKRKINRPYMDGILYEDYMVRPMKTHLEIFLDKDTYARKISFIDMTLQHYTTDIYSNK